MSERVVHTPAESTGDARPCGRLAGRRILVLGGGQMDIGESDVPIGNGRAIAVLCAREGARVAVADRDLKSAEVTAAMMDGKGFAIPADATKEDDIVRMVERAVSEMSGLDGIALNVGIGAGGAWLDGVTAENWDKVFAINLRSHMLTVKHAMAKLADASSIVFISSIAGLTAGSRLPAYDASKAALFGL
jgi:NAD(P)-dependent dehydrogenase (short-subunit alcohol dehydrogenase family)